ncbi:hypothetical protein GTA08_BOTSDO12365 [Botryosphaeria dothidea]|uniref:BTB domain-containing protein n=1 Tax=Botryosphaeria dothidea TaxID=55169 RepID=A0A8H4NEB3_9PEZI|nr:hypothetical protein GTA08_BOTSDO12365 [Botryosphaeria dothidea]
MPPINMALPGFVRGIKSDFHTGEYSDMRLIDRNGKVYNVHKLVLCHQSPWFQNAMKEGRFKVNFTPEMLKNFGAY